MAALNRYFVGLDLGPAGEYTALAVLERPRSVAGTTRPAYALRHLKRYPLGTPYPTIVTDLRDVLRTHPIQRAIVAADKTGVGQAVLDLFADGLRHQVTCIWCPVTVTAGVASGFENGRLVVSKLELVGTLQVLLQSRRLQVARSLPDAELLVRELEAYRVKVPAKATDALVEWREGPHDDLVFAVALAAWVGEQGLATGR